MKNLNLNLAAAAALLVSAAVPQARAGIALSSRTIRMMEDLETLSQVRPGEQGRSSLDRFFDNNRSAAAFEGTAWATRHPALPHPAQATPPRVFSGRGAKSGIYIPAPGLLSPMTNPGWGDRIVGGWNNLRRSAGQWFGYDYGYIPYNPYPIRWDLGSYHGEFRGYEWHQGYGYIPERVFTQALSGEYRFVPQRRGGGTIERAPGR